MSKIRTINELFEDRLNTRGRDLEIALRARQANVSPTGTPRTGVPLAAPVNLRVRSGVRSVVVDWDHVQARDFDHYEVQFATNTGFTAGVETYTPVQNSYEFSVGLTGTIYYSRVRAISQYGTQGPYSVVLNTTTGLIATGDLDVGAATEFATFTKSSGFAELNTNAETETYGPVSQTVYDANSVMRTLIRINFDLAVSWPADADASTDAQVTFETLRRPFGGGDTVLDTLTYDLHVTYPQYGTHKGRLSIPTFTVYDTPGAGLFEYRVRITTTIAQGGAASPPTLSFQGVLLNLELQQNKR